MHASMLNGHKTEYDDDDDEWVIHLHKLQCAPLDAPFLKQMIYQLQ